MTTITRPFTHRAEPDMGRAILAPTGCVPNPARDRIHVAARHLYDAECAVHSAHQTHVDAWIRAAADKLHLAIAEHLAAIIAAG